MNSNNLDLRDNRLQPEHATPPSEAKATADLVYLLDLPLKPVHWLWKDRLATGSLAMISGAPGSGKTWIALDVAAALSRGRAPVTSEPCDPCNILYASSGHGSTDIIHRRFAALLGDLARLAILRQPAASRELCDTAVLEDALDRTHARLLILDAFPVNPRGGFDAAQTVAVLDRLAGLAESHHCCILLLRQRNRRGPGRPPRTNESSAAIHTEFLAGSSPDAPAHTALLRRQSKLGPLTQPLAYAINAAGTFAWTGSSTLIPEVILADRPSGAGMPKRRFAGQWLRQYLQAGSKSQYTVEQDAHREGVCIATLRRAKFDLGVSSSKDGVSGVWYWTLPGITTRQPNQH